jgi:hypothetical protein
VSYRASTDMKTGLSDGKDEDMQEENLKDEGWGFIQS